jgi:hypothetical protein
MAAATELEERGWPHVTVVELTGGDYCHVAADRVQLG